MNILTVNPLVSALVFWIAARLYILRRLHTLALHHVRRPCQALAHQGDRLKPELGVSSSRDPAIRRGKDARPAGERVACVYLSG